MTHYWDSWITILDGFKTGKITQEQFTEAFYYIIQSIHDHDDYNEGTIKQKLARSGHLEKIRKTLHGLATRMNKK